MSRNVLLECSFLLSGVYIEKQYKILACFAQHTKLVRFLTGCFHYFWLLLWLFYQNMTFYQKHDFFKNYVTYTKKKKKGGGGTGTEPTDGQKRECKCS